MLTICVCRPTLALLLHTFFRTGGYKEACAAKQFKEYTGKYYQTEHKPVVTAFA